MYRRMSSFLMILVSLLLVAPSAWAQDTPPAIDILTPTEGEIVSPSQVVVTGTGSALPENSVIVQALGDDGVIFGQDVVTVAAELGATGPWEATLRLRVPPGETGRIAAFATSPADGSRIALDTITVTFGGDGADNGGEPEATAEPEATDEPLPEPTQLPEPEPTEVPLPEPTTLPEGLPSLSISIPVAGEMVSPVEVVVVGQGSDLPENNVVVQALTDDGVLVGQEATTVDADLGGSGEWRATVALRVPPGTPGRLIAIAPSPLDGSILAQAAVDVIYGEGAPEATATPVPTEAPTEAPTEVPTAEPTVEPTVAPTAEPTSTSLPASVSITIPRPGETVSPVEVVVVGRGRSLPENNVVVQALDDNGAVLDQQAAIVDADLGGDGEWRVTLRPGAAAGASGRIVAFAPSPVDGSKLAEDAISVQYGAAPPQEPQLTIVAPPAGAFVNADNGFSVTGVGRNLAEGNVVVELLDSQGVRLTRKSTTLNADGNWSVALYPGPLSEPGTIRAYAMSVTGTVAVEDQVAVRFVTMMVPTPAPPVPPAITIEQPTDAGVVDATRGFTVQGTAVNVFESNVIVRVRDNFGRTLRQTVTTADQTGKWAVDFSLLVENGADGSIYAFSTSPVDGAVVTDDVVRISFRSGCAPRTDWPVYVVVAGDTLFSVAQKTGSSVGELMTANCLSTPNVILVGQRLYVPNLPTSGTPPAPALAIESQAADSVVELYAPLTVTGVATGTQPGNLFVRLLDNDGSVLEEARGQVIDSVEGGDVWQWEVELPTTQATTGQRGALFAYSLSLVDGTLLTTDYVPVQFGFAAEGAFIAIDDPQPYAAVEVVTVLEQSADELPVLLVSGRAGALFENNVVVRLEDGSGEVVVEVPTTITTDEVGGTGAWTVELPVDYVGRGRIVAYAPSPVDGTAMASAAVDVTVGDPNTQASFVQVTYPLPGALVTDAAEFYALAGYAGSGVVESVTVLVQDGAGNIRFILPAEVDPATGFWSTVIRLTQPIEQAQSVVVNVIAASSADGTIVAGDRVVLQTRPEQGFVTGTVGYLERIALPSGAVVTVDLQDVSRADALAIRLGQQVITNPGQVPVPFAIAYNPDDIDPRGRYVVRADIFDAQGNRLFLTTTSYPVITGNSPETVDVMLESAQ